MRFSSARIAEPLVTQPGTKVEYSDLGFMLLGEIVERLTGQTLDQFARENIFAPLGMNDSYFNPPRSLRAQIAPTENDTAFRKRQLQGEVHDGNAFAMGGIAGHAGLFSTAQDISVFAQMMLNGGMYAQERIFARDDDRSIHGARECGRFGASAGLGCADGEFVERTLFVAASLRPQWIYGNFDVDRPGKGAVCDSADESRLSFGRERQDPPGAPALHDAIIEGLGLSPQHAAAR